MNYETLLVEMEKYKDEMTPMERMMAYAKGEEVDHIPLSTTGGDVVASLYGYTIGEYRRSFDVKCKIMEYTKRDLCGSGGAAVLMGLKGIGEALGSELKYPENGLDYVSNFVLTDYDMMSELEERFNPETNPFLQEKLAQISQYKQHFGDKFNVATNVAGPLTTAVSIRKTENVLKDMVKNKEMVHELLSMSVRCSLKWLEIVTDEFGPTMAGFADPASSMNLISPTQFREFSKPHLQDLLAGFKRITGRIPGTHICGRTKAIWQDLVDLGIPSFSVDNCEDLSELKAAVGDKMAISGNVPPVQVMQNGTIDDVIQSVQQCLIKGSDSPMGYSLALGCQMPVGTPMENIQAYIYAGRRYGRGAKKGQLCKGLSEEGLI
ncbi:MAG: uroporphyrinogen decarboxylase family protein [Oscillospiraceae bacterium]